jgi:hypothetical protein
MLRVETTEGGEERVRVQLRLVDPPHVTGMDGASTSYAVGGQYPVTAAGRRALARQLVSRRLRPGGAGA